MRHEPISYFHPETRVTSLGALFHGTRAMVQHSPGHAIAAHGDPVERLYQVVAGAVRCCSFTESGRRQIFRFARAGEFLGFTDVGVWRFTAEAVDSVLLRSISMQAFEAAFDRSPTLRRAIRVHAAAALAARERQLTMLAFEPAVQRLHWFLQEFADKRSREGFVTLPMTRQEIGDYLGLSLETVSRSFGALTRAGLIELKGSDRYRLKAQPLGRAA